MNDFLHRVYDIIMNDFLRRVYDTIMNDFLCRAYDTIINDLLRRICIRGHRVINCYSITGYFFLTDFPADCFARAACMFMARILLERPKRLMKPSASW
jgi:hypothetical protein